MVLGAVPAAPAITGKCYGPEKASGLDLLLAILLEMCLAHSSWNYFRSNITVGSSCRSSIITLLWDFSHRSWSLIWGVRVMREGEVSKVETSLVVLYFWIQHGQLLQYPSPNFFTGATLADFFPQNTVKTNKNNPPPPTRDYQGILALNKPLVLNIT